MREQFDSYKTSTLFKTIEKNLGVNCDRDCQELKFSIPSSAGSGKVSYFQYHDGLSNFLFDGQLKTDWQWEFQCADASPLYIFFLLSGRLEDVRQDGSRFPLEPMETLMVVRPGGPDSRSIVFKAGEHIKVSVVALKKEKFLTQKCCGLDDLPTNLQLLLSMKDKEVQSLFPPDRTTLDTSLIVEEILGCEHKGLMRNCFVEAKTRELLLISFERSGSDFVELDKVPFLKNVDLGKILQARHLLIKDLKNAPTIEELSRMVGVNRQKLKVDFKASFGKTIFQYLREERMHTAKSMLMNARVTIQEVASAVGYESTSHFSRRFKEQFGILPSKFSAIFWRKGQEN